jgi:hypothetical protein
MKGTTVGMNYYLHENECDCCGHAQNILHIGKSSSGWCFGLHVIPEENLNSLADWVDRWSKTNCTIRDEGNTKIEVGEMYLIITSRSADKHEVMIRGVDHKAPTNRIYRNLADFYERNFAVPGPNNLLRHKFDDKYCIGHPEGTWDLLTGEFS